MASRVDVILMVGTRKGAVHLQLRRARPALIGEPMGRIFSAISSITS